MFLTKDELKTRSNIELIDAITRNDGTIIEIIISESIALMKGYLSARFDVAVIFAGFTPPDPDNRDPVVLKILKDIVIYEVYSSHNPNIMSKVVNDNMERAINWLKEVQACNINPDLPKHPDPQTINYIISGSNTKRSLHY
jgi:hypothetical protein